MNRYSVSAPHTNCTCPLCAPWVYELPKPVILHPVYPECRCAQCQAVLHPPARTVAPPPDYVPGGRP